MKLTFCGGAQMVTGSCHLVETNGYRILIDCGLKQGKDEYENDIFPFRPSTIDYAIVTHAHIDHSGRLPLLVKEGFQGSIITTALTARLLEIMLLDSAHIQESDAQWQNQKGKRAGHAVVEPLYTTEDARESLTRLVSYHYQEEISLCPGVTLRFIDAGHLLGSAYVQLTLREGETEKTIVFSGDIGNRAQPVIRDPQKVTRADYVVTESTYGNREHEGEEDYALALARILDETFAQGGNVIIPAFAVGRTQELLYKLREIKAARLVKSLPDFEVYVDSPLARATTRIFSGDLTGYLDEEAAALVADGVGMFTFPGLQLCESAEESRALNLDKKPKVIISASGMCDAGRIRHHLKHNLWRTECSVVFVGFQAEGSFGRHLLNGASSVKMFGEEIRVAAQIINFKGLSGHADRTGLLDWISAFDPKPQHVFVVHGEASVSEEYAQTLRELGHSAHAPLYTEEYDLMTNSLCRAGFLPPRKKSAIPAESPLFRKLVETAERLMHLVRGCRGWANKDLKRLTGEIAALLDKWK